MERVFVICTLLYLLVGCSPGPPRHKKAVTLVDKTKPATHLNGTRLPLVSTKDGDILDKPIIVVSKNDSTFANGFWLIPENLPFDSALCYLEPIKVTGQMYFADSIKIIEYRCKYIINRCAFPWCNIVQLKTVRVATISGKLMSVQIDGMEYADPSLYTKAKIKNQTSPDRRNQDRTHIVKKGETLMSIARHYGVTLDKLKKENQLKSEAIKIDQRLKIPSHGS